MGEDRLGPGEVELAAECLEVEALVGAQRRLLLDEAVARKLDFARGLEHVRVLLDAVVIAAVEVADEVDAAAQGAAADVEEGVLRLEALRLQVVELRLAVLLPLLDVADRPAVPLGVEVVVVAGRDVPANRALDGHGNVRLDLDEQVLHGGHVTGSRRFRSGGRRSRWRRGRARRRRGCAVRSRPAARARRRGAAGLRRASLCWWGRAAARRRRTPP